MKKFIYLFCCFIVSCNYSPESNPTYPDGGTGGYPEYPYDDIYATEYELDRIYENYKNENVLNWKMARFLAFDELYKMEQEKSWEGATISKTPILIYDSSQKPKYYEFRVIKDKSEVGTITANVFPNGGAIAYVLDNARDYHGCLHRSRMYSDSKIIENNYPNVGGIASLKRSGEVDKIYSINGEIQTVTNYYDTIEDYLNDGGSVSELASSFGVSEAEIISANNERKRVEAQLESDFILMNEALVNVENLSDEEVKNMLYEPNLRGIKRWRSNIIPAYRAIALKRYHFGYFNCGSSALAWIYAGINKYYDGKDILNSELNRRNFAWTLERLLGTTGSGVTFPWKFSGALKNITGNTYRMDLSRLFFGNTDSHMKTSQLPVLSLRMSRVYSPDWHYRVIYGAIWINEEHKFLWWKWSIDHSYKFYMHDNGADGPNGVFMESSWHAGFFHLKVVKN